MDARAQRAGCSWLAHRSRARSVWSSVPEWNGWRWRRKTRSPRSSWALHQPRLMLSAAAELAKRLRGIPWKAPQVRCFRLYYSPFDKVPECLAGQLAQRVRFPDAVASSAIQVWDPSSNVDRSPVSAGASNQSRRHSASCRCRSALKTGRTPARSVQRPRTTPISSPNSSIRPRRADVNRRIRASPPVPSAPGCGTRPPLTQASSERVISAVPTQTASR